MCIVLNYNKKDIIMENKTTVVKPAKKKNYLNNTNMLIELKLSREQGRLTENFARMMMMLTDKFASKPCYAGYTYLPDMKAYALFMICRTWDRFNVEKSRNPFSYFTQCITYSFWQYLNKEKAYRNKRDMLLINIGMNPSHNYMAEYEQEQHDNHIMNDMEIGIGTLSDELDYSSNDHLFEEFHNPTSNMISDIKNELSDSSDDLIPEMDNIDSSIIDKSLFDDNI